MKKTTITIILFTLLISNGFSQDIRLFFDKTDSFLKTYVSNGLVGYSKIHSNPEALLELLKMAEQISVMKDDAENYQAFWINAYNLGVIKGLIDNYPTYSPLDIKGFFDKTKYSFSDTKITLNDIEHKLLRAQFNDARFHFVLVCGAIGCPPLTNKAYLPETLNEQLEEQTKLALNGNFLQVDSCKKRIKASQIMEWYKEDFTMHGITEIDFINKYRTQKIEGNYKLSYFPYDWRINKQ